MSKLPECIESFRRAGAKHILLIPFEDRTLRDRIERQLGQCDIEVWTKADLAGLSLRRLMKKLHSRRWDAVVVSVYQSAVKRSRSSAEFLLACSNAPLRWMRSGEDEYFRSTARSAVLSLLPRILVAGVLGLCAVVWYYGLLFRTHRRRTAKKNFRASSRGTTILFLRTDLAGPLKAGGSNSHVKGMIQAFLRAGFQVLYVADAPIEGLPNAVIQLPLPPVSLLDILDEFQLIAYNWQLLRYLNRRLREFSITLVYQRHSIFNVFGGLLARRLRIPFVLETNASEVWVKRNWSRLVFEDLAVRSESLALQLADHIAVISKGVEEQLLPSGLVRSKVLLNPNGVDPEEFHPSVDGNEIRARWKLQDTLVVGFIGTFTRWHGVETLFEAAAQCIRQNARLYFLLVGDGDLRSTLQHRAEELHITDRLIFTGLIPHAEAPRYLAACDILASPHLGFEGNQKFFGSPTKLFEYMAMGKAIIASRLEQIGEVIVDGVNGLHMEPGNIEQLRNKIVELANDEPLRRRLGAQARTDVVREYTWDRNVDRILNSLR